MPTKQEQIWSGQFGDAYVDEASGQNESKPASPTSGNGRASTNILMLFAPKFIDFGCDIARELLKDNAKGKVFGLCTGPRSVLDRVSAQLEGLVGRLWSMEAEEQRWISTPVSTVEVARFDNSVAPGTFGRWITADRRVGKGFVCGGLTRPDDLGAVSVTEPNVVPQRYIVHLHRFLSEVLAEAKPNLVFAYAVAGAPMIALAELCRTQNITFSRFNTTRIGSGFIVDDDPTGHLAPVARRFAEIKQNFGDFSSELDKASQYLTAFRHSPKPPEYYIRNSAAIRSRASMQSIARGLGDAALQLAHDGLKRDLSLSKSRRHLFKLRATLKTTQVNRKYFSTERVLPDKFVYFPLHVDPEASTMVLAPWHTDQISIIEALAKSSPASMTILVKEHLPMIGLRPPGFYERIIQMPRVMLVGPSYSGIDLVKASSLTAVITGTAAWEALCLGRPALIIGDSPFLPIKEGYVHEPSLWRLPKAISEALELAPASDEALEAFIASAFVESFDMPPSLLWGEYKDHPQELRKKVVDRIAADLKRISLGSKARMGSS